MKIIRKLVFYEVIKLGLFYGTDKTIMDLLKEKKNFILIGEAGSGKSEITLNLAVKLAEMTDKKVDIFDLDQTKPLFRSRDMKEAFAERGIDIYYQDQFLDAPSQVGGVIPSLLSDHYTILDIGGGHQAAKYAGAYNHILRNEDSVAIYVVNPYRPWTKSAESIDGTMSHILKSVRLNQIYVLGNPNLGYATTVDEFVDGLEKLDELLGEFTTVTSSCVRQDIYEEAQEETDKYLLPIELFLTYSWVD